jgi:hypothetical protein
VGVSCVAFVCLCLASALCLSAPMLLGVSLVPLCNTLHTISDSFLPSLYVKLSFAEWCVCAIAPSFLSGWRAFSSVSRCKSVKLSYVRLGAPALTLLGDLAAQAVQGGGPGLSRAAFISGALRELSVALCRGNASLCRSGACVATRAAGRTPMRGRARPSAEVV